MSRKVFTQEEEQEIIRLYQNEEFGYRKIVDHFGKGSVGVIQRTLLQYGIPLRGNGDQRTFNDEEELEIVRLYVEKKFSYQKIIKHFDKGGTANIRRILEKHNIVLGMGDRYKCFTQEEELEIVRLYTEEKLGLKNILKQLDKGYYAALHDVLSRHDIPVFTYDQHGDNARNVELDSAICKLYQNRRLSALQLAKRFNKTKQYIYYVLGIYKIPRRSPAKHFSKKIIQEIITRYQKGESSIFLGRVYNVGNRTVRKLLRKNNIVLRESISKKLQRTLQERSSEILEQYNQGKSACAIAKSLDIHVDCILLWLRKQGVKTRSLNEAQNSEEVLYRRWLLVQKLKVDFVDIPPDFETYKKEWSTLAEYIKNNPGHSLKYWSARYAVAGEVIRRIIHRNKLYGYVPRHISTANEKWIRLIKEILNIEPEWSGNVGEYHGFTNIRCSVDLWFPEQRVGVDINPTYTHSTQHVIEGSYNASKPVTYHQERALDAERNGWLLYQIYDWNDEHSVLQQLRHLLKLDNEHYQARKCILVNPSEAGTQRFLNDHHRQGYAAAGSICIGLQYRDELVGVMTFGKERFKEGHVMSGPDEYELIRFATRGTVVGGASRMFQYFIREHNPARIKTFASLDSGQGKIYEKLGFRFERLAGLNAWYSKPGTKQAYKVTLCSRKFRSEYERLGMSQQEYMNALGFYRINDAGNKVFIWTRDNK
jgi:transposase-like protein